jgi:hypothetical protein
MISKLDIHTAKNAGPLFARNVSVGYIILAAFATKFLESF